jgi:hypothetical protein
LPLSLKTHCLTIKPDVEECLVHDAEEGKGEIKILDKQQALAFF